VTLHALRVGCALGALCACSIDDRHVTFAAAGGARAHAAGTAGMGGGGDSDAGDGGVGAKGDGGAPPALCTGVPPESALVTDFSDAEGITDDEGNPGLAFSVASFDSGGQTFVYALFGLALPQASLAGDEPGTRALRIVAVPEIALGDPSPAVGFGLGWLACLDASAYEGFSFTLRGTLGGCSLMPGVQISQNTNVDLNVAASCELETRCAPPRSAPITAEGIYRVRFSDMTGGSPLDGVDASTIVGFNWLLLLPAEGEQRCQADFTLDDVAFFP
jgi:hypothetical protein